MLKAVIIGLGKQSSKHAQAILELGGRVVLGVDPQPGARDSFSRNFNVEVTGTLEFKILSQTRANIAVVCTPVLERYELIKKLAERGIKRFVVEKPLCLTHADCERLIQIEKHENIEIYVNFTYRFSSPYYQLKRKNAVDQYQVDYGMFYIGGKGSHRVWKHKLNQGGGAYNEMAIHMMDLANYLFGASTCVQLNKEALVRPVRLIEGIEEDVDANDLVVVMQTHEKNKRKSLIVADFLSPSFSNRVQLVSQEKQIECSIGEKVQGLTHAEMDSIECEDFGENAYKRLYQLIDRGDVELMHRPIDTLALIKLK